MSLDVLILTRQRREELTANLDLLVPQLEPGDTITVLENGCPDRSTDGLAERFPDVTFHHSEENLGVTGGRNALARHATTDVLVWLDDDARPDGHLLARVRKRFADGAVDVLAFRIDDPDTGAPRGRNFPHRDKSLIDEEFEPSYFNAGGCAMRRSLFEATGGYDEHLFYSLEELDLAFRLQARGARIVYDPHARMEHLASDEGRPPDQFVRYGVRNRWWVPVKHLPWPMAISHIVLWTGYLLLVAARNRQLRFWWQGLREGVRHLPGAIRRREPLGRAVVARLREQGGRLWW